MFSIHKIIDIVLQDVILIESDIIIMDNKTLNTKKENFIIYSNSS